MRSASGSTAGTPGRPPANGARPSTAPRRTNHGGARRSSGPPPAHRGPGWSRRHARSPARGGRTRRPDRGASSPSARRRVRSQSATIRPKKRWRLRRRTPSDRSLVTNWCRSLTTSHIVSGITSRTVRKLARACTMLETTELWLPSSATRKSMIAASSAVSCSRSNASRLPAIASNGSQLATTDVGRSTMVSLYARRIRAAPTARSRYRAPQ